MYPKYTVSARDHGLTEGEAFQTAAIQAAIDDVFTHGGGEVTIPAGRYLTGGLRLRSGVTLHLLENACLLGSQDPDDYDILECDTLEPIPHDDQHKRALSRWNHGLIMLVDAENVAIIGEKGSVIDGRDCYDPVGEEHYRGPHGIHAINSRNLTFRGYTIQNTGNWAHCILSCRAIEAENLTVLAGHDGFHVRACENIRVEHCVFHTGDDAIAGFADLNMVVRDCELNSAC
ncbi:MAG: right-handed parallel beta-helix repeat-containing protein, partial [Clostridia bacterium]|nr:right-handed parallel beta-helix repeat-containing protein [Clostridia bacterium]